MQYNFLPPQPIDEQLLASIDTVLSYYLIGSQSKVTSPVEYTITDKEHFDRELASVFMMALRIGADHEKYRILDKIRRSALEVSTEALTAGAMNVMPEVARIIERELSKPIGVDHA